MRKFLSKTKKVVIGAVKGTLALAGSAAILAFAFGPPVYVAIAVVPAMIAAGVVAPVAWILAIILGFMVFQITGGSVALIYRMMIS